MRSERMTPRERLTAFTTGDPVDRVPCVPLVLNQAARLIGAPIDQYARDARVMADAHVAAFRRYRHDLVSIFADTAITAEALGTQLEFVPDDVPRVARPAVAEPEDVDKLPTVDARTAGRLPMYLESIRRCNEAIGDEVIVACCFPAPFSTAAALRGTDMLARDLVKRPELAHALLEKSLAMVNDFSSAVVEAGGLPALVDPVASGSLLSRRAFETFVVPTLTRALDHIRELGALPILHICGRTSHVIDLMADTGAAVLSIDQIDLAEAGEKVGDRVCLMGNVQPAQTMLEGTPDDVRREARACLAAARDNPGGFILATGCEVPIEAPPENVEALMEVARTDG